MADENTEKQGELTLEEELQNLSNTQKAAVLMLLLGEDQAANIIKYLGPKEVQNLGAAMTSVQDLSQEAINAVLDEFLSFIKKQSTIGLGSHQYIETVLNKALGPDKAASIINRIMPGKASKGLEILEWMDARAIADMIRSEHPQVIAIILSVVEPQVAADVLAFLAKNVRAEVVRRVASLETVQPSAMEELEVIMKQQFADNTSAASATFGGVAAAAKIMNFVKSDLETSVMGGVEEIDADIAGKIQDNMLSFENLGDSDNRSIQTLMRNVEPDMLMIALKGATEPVKDKFFGNMSSRAAAMFQDEMEAKGMLRMTDVDEAQKAIMRIAKKLSDKGELVLAGRGDDYV